MSKRNDLSKIAVVDLEATCWEQHPPPRNEQSDVIEFGISFLNIETLDIEGPSSWLVKPYRSNVSKFCTKLTSITQEMVDKNGLSWISLLNTLKSYNTRKFTWASFGNYDLNMLRSQCNIFSYTFPMGYSHINIKNLFALVYNQKKEVGMKNALKILGLEFIGNNHRAGDDSYNAARILQYTLKKMRGSYGSL